MLNPAKGINAYFTSNVNNVPFALLSFDLQILFALFCLICPTREQKG